MSVGRKIITLGEAFKTVTGNTPSKGNPAFFGNFVPLVKPPELCDSILDSAEDGLSESGSKVARIAPANSILVSCIGNLGKIGFNTGPVAFNQQINAILPNLERAVPQFMFYQVLSPEFRAQLEALSSGTTVPIVNKSRFNSIEIVLPPLPEQRRIVGILDEAFAGIATARAHAEQNRQNARALFESHLHTTFTKRDPGWVEKSFGEIADFKNGLNFNRNSCGQTLPIVGVADFQSNDFVPNAVLESATIDGTLDDGYALKRNDILTVRSNGSKHLVGRCMLVADLDEITSYSGFIIRIRFDEKLIHPRFLLHFLKCSATRDILTSGGGGANITNINQVKLSALLVSFPVSLIEQIRIVRQLDALQAETRRLEALYTRKLAALDELKAALLHQAFSGML